MSIRENQSRLVCGVRVIFGQSVILLQYGTICIQKMPAKLAEKRDDGEKERDTETEKESGGAFPSFNRQNINKSETR